MSSFIMVEEHDPKKTLKFDKEIIIEFVHLLL